MATEAILKYLVNTNRPYSANDITLNLHKEFGKAAIQKGLDELVETNCIREKVYGKQKVYCALQKDSTESSESTVAQLDEAIKDKQKQVFDLQRELNSHEANLKQLLSEPTISELEAENAQIVQTNEKLRQRLSTLTSGKVELVTVDQRTTVKKEYDVITVHQRKRKRMATDILDSILEGYPKSKMCLYEEIGIELDP